MNVMMVATGHAWHYVKYAPDDEQLAKAKAAARKQGWVIWSTGDAVPPWEWRKR